MKKWALALTAAGVAGAPLAQTTIYGEAVGNVSIWNTDEGVSMQLWDDGTHFGFRGDSAITNDVSAVFDLRYGITFMDDPTSLSGFSMMSGSHVGIAGEYGTGRVFYGPTPITKTNDYLQLMDKDPVNFPLVLGAGSSAANVLPMGTVRTEGLGFTSRELEGGLSVDGALIPSEDPDGTPGFGLSATLSRALFQMTGGAEFNVGIEDSQLFRVVGEYYLNQLTLGGLVQRGSNSDLDASATSIAGFLEMPMNMTRWDTGLKVLGGVSLQTNDADTLDESQTFFSGVHEIRYNDKVSSFTFAELYGAEDDVNNHFAGGGGLRIRF